MYGGNGTGTGTEEASPCSYVRAVEVRRASPDASCGFHLSRSKWDPYPWVSLVEEGSAAAEAGVRPGDCVLELNGEDIVGRRICDLADLVRSPDCTRQPLEMLLWNAGVESDCTPEALCCGPMPLNMQRLSACMSSVIAHLECPVCFTTICPPACQCVNGHLLCIRCHAKSDRCPVCRVKLSRGRCLFADQVFNSLVESFGLNKKNNNQQMSDKIKQMFKQKSKWKDIPVIKVSQPKILQNLLVDRALSAENLTGNGWRAGAALKVTRAYLDEPHLKTKSLSACDIPAACGGGLRASSSVDGMGGACDTAPAPAPACHCPFRQRCAARPPADSLLGHFQELHAADGPLVQYFTPDATFSLAQCHTHPATYYFHFNHKSFFLKILTPTTTTTATDHSTSTSGVLIWMWFVGEPKVENEYHLDLSVKRQDSATCLINMSSPLFSLDKWSWETIQMQQKGSFISMETIQALTGNSNTHLNLEINIRHSFD